jgi:predicted O-methyltransferase YrrM
MPKIAPGPAELAMKQVNFTQLSPFRMMRLAARRTRQFKRLLDHSKADEINFLSGLGDSSYLLYGLVRSMKPEVCVEIGSARGRSACFIGMALKENGRGKLFAIDPHRQTSWNDLESNDTFEIMKTNLAAIHVTNQVEIVRMTSEEAARGWSRQIDMIFIDGDHSYEGIKRDWELFLPYLTNFGVVIFHDTIWDLRPDPRWSRSDMGVPRFVDELRQQGYPVVTIDKDCGVSLVQPARGGLRLKC